MDRESGESTEEDKVAGRGRSCVGVTVGIITVMIRGSQYGLSSKRSSKRELWTARAVSLAECLESLEAAEYGARDRAALEVWIDGCRDDDDDYDEDDDGDSDDDVDEDDVDDDDDEARRRRMINERVVQLGRIVAGQFRSVHMLSALLV